MVLLEAILFGSLLLYFPVSLWLELIYLLGSPQSQPGTLHPRICPPLYPVGGFGDLKIPLLLFLQVTG